MVSAYAAVVNHYTTRRAYDGGGPGSLEGACLGKVPKGAFSGGPAGRPPIGVPDAFGAEAGGAAAGGAAAGGAGGAGAATPPPRPLSTPTKPPRRSHKRSSDSWCGFAARLAAAPMTATLAETAVPEAARAIAAATIVTMRCKVAREMQ